MPNPNILIVRTCYFQLGLDASLKRNLCLFVCCVLLFLNIESSKMALVYLFNHNSAYKLRYWKLYPHVYLTTYNGTPSEYAAGQLHSIWALCICQLERILHFLLHREHNKKRHQTLHAWLQHQQYHRFHAVAGPQLYNFIRFNFVSNICYDKTNIPVIYYFRYHSYALFYVAIFQFWCSFSVCSWDCDSRFTFNWVHGPRTCSRYHAYKLNVRQHS